MAKSIGEELLETFSEKEQDFYYNFSFTNNNKKMNIRYTSENEEEINESYNKAKELLIGKFVSLNDTGKKLTSLFLFDEIYENSVFLISNLNISKSSVKEGKQIRLLPKLYNPISNKFSVLSFAYLEVIESQ